MMRLALTKPFDDAREIAVAFQVIQAVHVQLTRHQLMQKFPWIGPFEDLNGQGQLAVKTLIEVLHQRLAHALVVQALQDHALQRMRKRPMADVVQKNGDECGLVFLGTDRRALGAQHIQGLSRQVHRANAMVEAAMHRARIHQRTQCQLLNAAQPLKHIGIDQIQDDPPWNFDKPVHGVVDDLVLIHNAQSQNGQR